mgnify:CR=1 FL=1
MKRISVLIATTLLLIACGGSNPAGELSKMQDQLAKLKKQKSEPDVEIRGLEGKIAKLDTAGARQASRLVTVDSVRSGEFLHYIDLQGKIEAEGMAYVAPAGMGSQVKAVFVKLGTPVQKGQMILKLDDAIALQQLSAARQQSGQLKTRLAQAQTIYERYQNLWKQNIGAEIQVINAKADVDALAAQLRAVEAQVGMAEEQVNMTNVRAAIPGVIDEMNVRVGEQRSIPINRTGTGAFVSVNRTDTDGTAIGVGFFKVMDDLIAGLNNSKGADVSRGVGELDNLQLGVSLARAEVGTNLNVVDQQTSVIEDMTLNLKTTLSSIEDLDYASAITKMNQQMLSLEAAQSSFAKVSQLNLFNYIK